MDHHLLRAAGPLAHAYRGVDWASTSLGPMESWAPRLRGAVEVLLGTRVPTVLYWGPERVMLYNEAFVVIIGDKHPDALGTPAKAVMPEAWDILGPLVDRVLAGQGSTWAEDLAVPMARHGFLEQCYFTFSCSPVRGADGHPEGVLGVGLETTEHVLARRRLEIVGELGRELVGLEDVAELPGRFVDVVVSVGQDVTAIEVRLPGQSLARRGSPLPAEPQSPLGNRDLLVEKDVVGHVAWLPLRSGGTVEPAVLVVGLNPRLDVDRSFRLFLRLLASTLDNALGRLTVLEAERLTAEGQRQLSASLQRALLTQPMAPDHLQVAVRYEPAADIAQVGGDWHDSFLLPSGALALSIGDVAGHDREAAAAMAQARNLLRGIFFGDPDVGPADVLDRLDTAVQALGVAPMATAVVARVEQTEEQRAAGLRTLRWSNAGHPPPVLIDPVDGVRLLEADPERLLGLPGSAGRTDHAVTLRPGAKVVLCTDGLVERRGAVIDDGLAWLCEVLRGTEGLDAEAVCDLLLDEVLPHADDDIALLVLQAHPQ